MLKSDSSHCAFHQLTTWWSDPKFLRTEMGCRAQCITLYSLFCQSAQYHIVVMSKASNCVRKGMELRAQHWTLYSTSLHSTIWLSDQRPKRKEMGHRTQCGTLCCWVGWVVDATAAGPLLLGNKYIFICSVDWKFSTSVTGKSGVTVTTRICQNRKVDLSRCDNKNLSRQTETVHLFMHCSLQSREILH